MGLHLEAVSRMVSPGAHAVLVCDGAGWHQTGGRLRVRDNISLLPLPSTSPQLNPIENVWAFLRANHLNQRVWDSHDAIVDTCCQAWNAFITNLDRVASVTHALGHRSAIRAVGIRPNRATLGHRVLAPGLLGVPQLPGMAGECQLQRLGKVGGPVDAVMGWHRD